MARKKKRGSRKTKPVKKTSVGRRKGYGTFEVHGRTYRAWYFRPDPNAPSGFSRGPENTGIDVPIRKDYSDEQSYRSAVRDAEAQVETWLEVKTAPYRLSVKHGKLISDKKQLVSVLKERINATEGGLLGCEADMHAADSSLPGYTIEQAWEAFDKDNASKINSANGEARDPATHRNYKEWYGIFTRWLAEKHPEVTELRGVTARIAREYATDLIKKVRATTYNRHLNALSLIWRTLKQTDTDGKSIFPDARLGNNPFAYDKTTESGLKRFKITKAQRHKRETLTAEEIHKLLTTASGPMKGLIALGFYTGLRLGDCALMRFNQFDRANWTLTNTSHKTGVSTFVRVHPTLRAVLAETTHPSCPSDYLFPEYAALYNGRFDANAALLDEEAIEKRKTTGRVKLSKMIEELFQQCGITTSFKADGDSRARPDKTFHSLRHSLATMLKTYGADIETRKRILGHTTNQMALHYSEHHDGEADGSVLMLPDLINSDGSKQEAPEITNKPLSDILISLSNLNPTELHKVIDMASKRLSVLR